MKIKCHIKPCKNEIELTDIEKSYYEFFTKSGFMITKLCPYHFTLQKHLLILSDKWLIENKQNCGIGIDSYDTILKICTGSSIHGIKFSHTIMSKALDDLPIIQQEALRLTKKELELNE